MPLPVRAVSMPVSSKASYASTTVPRDTWSNLAVRREEGRRALQGNVPLRIAETSRFSICFRKVCASADRSRWISGNVMLFCIGGPMNWPFSFSISGSKLLSGGFHHGLRRQRNHHRSGHGQVDTVLHRVLGLKLTNRFGNDWATVLAGEALTIGIHPASAKYPTPGTK